MYFERHNRAFSAKYQSPVTRLQGEVKVEVEVKVKVETGEWPNAKTQ